MKRLCALLIISVPRLLGAQELGLVEWPYVGAEQGHSKYSSVDQINRSNVDQLEIAWEWEPNELSLIHI